MNSQLKRKRDAGLPRIMFSAANKTFARIFKEDSLRELKDLVREKLSLPSSQELHFSYAQEDRHLDLEDEGDFDAFYCFAHAMPLGKMVHVNVQIGEIVSIAPTPPIHISEEPVEKRQKSGASPKKVSEPGKDTPRAEAAPPIAAPIPDEGSSSSPPSEPVNNVSTNREAVGIGRAVPETPIAKITNGTTKPSAKPKTPASTKEVEPTPTRPKKAPAKAMTPPPSGAGSSSPIGPHSLSPLAEKATGKKALVETQPALDKGTTAPTTTQGEKITAKSAEASERTPAKKGGKKAALTEEGPAADKPTKGKKALAVAEKKAAIQASPVADKEKEKAEGKEKKRKRDSAKDVEEEPAVATPSNKRKKKKEAVPAGTEKPLINLSEIVDGIIARASPSVSNHTPEPSNLEEDTSDAHDDGNAKGKPAAKKATEPKTRTEAKTPAKPKVEKPKSKAAESKAAALSSITVPTNSETCPVCKESPGHPPEKCPGLKTIASIKKRITELKKDKGDQTDHSKLIEILEQVIQSRKKGPRGTTPKVAPEQSTAQTGLKATGPRRVSEVTVQHSGESNSDNSGSEDDAPKATKRPVTKMPRKSEIVSMAEKKKMEDVTPHSDDEKSESSERLQLEDEEEESAGGGKKTQVRQASVSSDSSSASEVSARAPPPSAPPAIKSVVKNSSAKTAQTGSTSDRDSASVAKLLSSSSRGSSVQRDNINDEQPATPPTISSAPSWQALAASTQSQAGRTGPRGQTDEEDDELVSSPKYHNDLFLPSETQLQFPYSQVTKLSVLSPQKQNEDDVLDSDSEEEGDEDTPLRRSRRRITQPVVSNFPRLTDIQSQRPFSQTPRASQTAATRNLGQRPTTFQSLYGKDHSESESESSGTESESEPERISHIPLTRLAGGKRRK